VHAGHAPLPLEVNQHSQLSEPRAGHSSSPRLGGSRLRRACGGFRERGRASGLCSPARGNIGFPFGAVRLLAHRAGIDFYAAKTPTGIYCFAIGVRAQAIPSIDALACQGGTIGSFPSAIEPVADFSTLNATSNATYVTTLAGFAADNVSQVGLLDATGKLIYPTPVTQNVYAASDVPSTPASAIVAFDGSDTIVYRKQLTPPAMPQPATP
jgi:hypothetical protein